MYNETLIVSAIRFKDIWNRYKHTIKAGHFSEADCRQLFYKITELHKKDSIEEIPEDLFGVKLPAITAEELNAILPVLDDFAVRCKLSDISLQTAQILNNNNFLTPEDLQRITGSSVEVVEEKDVENRRIEVGSLSATKRYAVGFSPLDVLLGGGLAARELTLISAPPFGGKTHWLIKFSSHFIATKHTVIHFVLEDLPNDILKYYNIAMHCYSNEVDKINTYLSKYLCCYDYTDVTPNYAELCKAIEAVTSKISADLPPVFVIDYMDILCEGEIDRFKLTLAMRNIRKLANKYNAIVLTATQADASSWDLKYPSMSNLSESKIGKASVADVIIFFSQLKTEVQLGAGRLIVDKAKGRRLTDRVIPVYIDWDTFEINGNTE